MLVSNTLTWSEIFVYQILLKYIKGIKVMQWVSFYNSLNGDNSKRKQGRATILVRNTQS